MAQGKGKPGQKNILLWRIAAGLMVLVCLGVAGWLWHAGEQETHDAYDNGRRLLIRIDNGIIEGNPITIGMPKPAQPAHAPAMPAPSAESPSAESPVTPAMPAAPMPGTEGMPAPPQMPPPSADEQIKPSANPLPEQNPLLVEKSAAGPVPVIGSDGTKPWRYYAKPFERAGGKPMVAIIISGLGHNRMVATRALQLNENITVSFSPYARDIDSWGRAARITGHEILLDLPLQPSNYPVADPGPYGLLTASEVKENEARLQWTMSRLPVYAGFLTPQNEGFSSDDEDFKLLLQSLANRGLMMVIGREPAKNDTKEIIDHTNTAIVVADMLIDEDLSEATIQTRLATLEELAIKRGYAVGVAQAFPITVEQLKIWTESLAAKGIVLVPVTAIARLRFS